MGEPVDLALTRFDGIDRVIRDPLRFKLRLGIGEDAFASLRIGKRLQEVWDVGGFAASGAGVAASSTVATTFFASTASGGILSMIGMGTAAATPIGWVVAAAILSGGGYCGVTRLIQSYSGSRVDSIPKFINTPIDLLGASLFDLIGGLAVRVALIDGEIAEREREVIVRHFLTDWGYDHDYLMRSLDVIVADAGRLSVKDMAKALAAFQRGNPDCNPAAMRGELIGFLRDIAAADGVQDEREELAIEAIEAVMRRETGLSLRNAGRSVGAAAGRVGQSAGGLLGRLRPGKREA